MYNSIKYFEEECISKFEKLEDDFIKEPQKLAEYILNLTDELHNLGLRMIQESLEEMNTAGLKRIAAARDYILSNWMAAKLRLRHQNGVKGSSTEGHVSHVLSSRMSSRPMGWSIQGATKMAKLRAYEMNGGDMLALVRYQKRELPKAAGAEYDVINSSDMLQAEKNRHGELGKYVDCITHTLSLQNKKKAYFNSHIWGL